MLAVTCVQTRPTATGTYDPAKGQVSYAELRAVGPDDAPALTRLVQLLAGDDPGLAELLSDSPPDPTDRELVGHIKAAVAGLADDATVAVRAGDVRWLADAVVRAMSAYRRAATAERRAAATFRETTELLRGDA